MQNPSSFFETTPPRRSMSRSESDSKILRHTRSFSRFLFFGSAKNKEDEKLVEDMVSPGWKSSKKTHARTGGAQISFSDTIARDAVIQISPNKSRKAKNLFSSSTSSIPFDTSTRTARPARPLQRPSLSILTGRDSFGSEGSSPSPTRTRTRTMYETSSAPQAKTRGRVASLESDTSSVGPQTPYDDSGSSVPPSTDSKSAWYPSHRPGRMPIIASAPLQRNPSAPIIEQSSKAVSQPVTPTEAVPARGISHSINWNLHTQLPSCSVSNDPSPLAGLIDEEYSESSSSTASTVPMPVSPAPAPTLRHALLVQQEKYRALKSQLQDAENAKEEREREIALLREEAEKRSEELKGLKVLLAEAEKQQKPQCSGSSEIGTPLTRSASMPGLSVPTHEVDVPSSARPGDGFEDGPSPSKLNFGLGINMDVDRSKSKRYGKAMMRPPPPPPPRVKPPTPGNSVRPKSSTSPKRSKNATSVSPNKVVTAVPVAPLNICRKKDSPQKRVDPLAEMDLLSKELRELKTSTALERS